MGDIVITGKLKKAGSASKNLMAASLLLGCTHAFALDAGKAPGGNFAQVMAAYVLQDFNGQDLPEEVSLTTTLQNSFFYSNCNYARDCYRKIPAGAMLFVAPSGFKATANSSYPRVELRARKVFAVGEVFDIVQTGTAYIVQSPKSKSIIFAQIHGDKTGGSELLKLRWKDGSVVAGTKNRFGDKEHQSTLLTGVKLNDRIDYEIQVRGSASAMALSIKVSAHGLMSNKQYSFAKTGWEGTGLYYKAGNYNQTADPDGAAAIVAYSALNIDYK